ncbi:MAG: hypothetical protein JWM41_4171 [Gemmatimonadetes bacterium]|nr:hypothetical protein [Gemmatimonadota bacterium]
MLPVLAVFGGCYGYYPVRAAAPTGRDVQVTLTDSGSVILAPRIGPSAEVVYGHVAGDSASAMLLALTAVRQRDGNEVDWKGEHVAIGRPLIARVDERRFSRTRTVLFSGAIAVALIAIRQGFQGNGFGFGGGKNSQGSAK